jgi:hypothetical protein
MAELAYLTSPFVTGILLLTVWVLVSRMENWRSYELTTAPLSGDRANLGDSPAAWTAGFFLMVLVATGGAVLLVSDVSLAAAIGGWTTIAGILGAFLLGYLLFGTYTSARNRGLHSSQAALLSAWLFGSLVVAAIAVKLLVTGG